VQARPAVLELAPVAIFKCLVNGAIDQPTRDRVGAALAELTRNRFGTPTAEVSVEFTEIPSGRWYTAGEPSEASMVLGTVPTGTSQAERELFMAEICRAFSDLTGADHDKIMIVAADER